MTTRELAIANAMVDQIEELQAVKLVNLIGEAFFPDDKSK